MDTAWSCSPAADGSDGDAYGSPGPRWRKMRAWLLAALLFCVAVFAIVFIATDHEIAFKNGATTTTSAATAAAAAAGPETPLPAVTSCGSTVAEARARGCRFEAHNFAWTPAACYDAELDAAWNAQEWRYARDAAGRTPIGRAEALAGEVEWAWVTLGQHVAHCVLMWQKLQRAVRLGRPADNWTTSFDHSRHCGHMLAQWDLPHDVLDSVLYLKFATCSYDYQGAPGADDAAAVLPTPGDGGIIGDFGNHADASGRNVRAGHESEHK